MNGSTFSDPCGIFLKSDRISDDLGDSRDLYYTDYLDYGPEKWAELLNSDYLPQVESVP